MKITKLMIISLMLFHINCGAKCWNEYEANGGIISSEGDYIIRNDSGGRIMDIWILRNKMVQSVQSSDGWLFKDNAGNMINLGGDVKIIRVKDQSVFEKYHEYHAEFETKTYEELYGTKKTKQKLTKDQVLKMLEEMEK